MIFNRIWERYYFHKFFSSSCLFLLLIYSLYIAIDFSLNFSNRSSSFIDTLFFYALELSKRLYILLPLALLLALIQTLCQSAQSNELTALLTGGVSKLRLLRPFFFVALCALVLELLNTQYILPYALQQIDNDNPKYINEMPLRTLSLKNGEQLIFQSYFPNKKSFFDTFWVISPNKIYKIKYLEILQHGARGQYVDELEKTPDGKFVKTSSYIEKAFPSLHIEPERLLKITKPAKNSSLSELWEHLQSAHEDESGVLWTWLLFKTLSPLICLLVILAPAPFCIAFQRHLKIFIIYCIALFLFIALYTILDATMVLGINGALSPFVAVSSPLLLYFIVFGIRFMRVI